MYSAYNIHRRGFRVSLKRKVYEYNQRFRDGFHLYQRNHFNVVAYINVTTKQAVRLLRCYGFRVHLRDLSKANNTFKGYIKTATYSKNSMLLTVQKRVKTTFKEYQDNV